MTIIFVHSVGFEPRTFSKKHFLDTDSLSLGKMSNGKKLGTARNGRCPPTHVFRSQSYPWSTTRAHSSLPPSRPLWRKLEYL